MFDLKKFVNDYVIKRNVSLFYDDIEKYDNELWGAIEGKSVLVIGGAGTIGSNFVYAVLHYKPAELYIVDINENALTELTRYLRSSGCYVPKIFYTYPMEYGSISFKRMFCNHMRSNGHCGFDIVANFSAHKHVRSEKDIYSIEALLRNNIINAKNLLDMLEASPPKSYFCVSTDKAANPVNIMGASKRIMEDLIFSYSSAFSVKTARFANVAFSNGSLPEGFLCRINNLQPLSAPLDVKRYFVSSEESGQICMLAALLGANREIMFPKLDESTMSTFEHIAVDLLHAYGYEPLYCGSDEEALRKSGELKNGSKWYPVHFSFSDTSGEKAFEEFCVDGELVDMERFCSLGVIIDKPMPDKTVVTDLINTLNRAFDRRQCSKNDIVKIIGSYLPNFEHIETGRNLDGKM